MSERLFAVVLLLPGLAAGWMLALGHKPAGIALAVLASSFSLLQRSQQLRRETRRAAIKD